MREQDYHQKQAHKTNSKYHWRHLREPRNHVLITLLHSLYKPSDIRKTLNELTSCIKSGTRWLCIICDEKPALILKS